MLAPDKARKLAAAFRLLDSPHEGEAQAALSVIRKNLPEGFTIGDLAERGGGDLVWGFARCAPKKPYRGPSVPPKPVRITWWSTQARECFRAACGWNEWERDFITKMSLREKPPTDPQKAVLEKLVRRARGLGR